MIKNPKHLFMLNKPGFPIIILSILIITLGISFMACNSAETYKPITSEKRVVSSLLKTSNLYVSPSIAGSGQEVIISADIINIGNEAEKYRAELKINNFIETDQIVEIAAGNTRRINFLVSKEIPGDYLVTFDNLSTSFTVESDINVIPAEEPEVIEDSNTQNNITAPASCCDPANNNAPVTGGASCCGSQTITNQPASPWGSINSGSCCGR